MKSVWCIILLYLALAMLAISCTETNPEPACTNAEVIGQDCANGWYILKLGNNPAAERGAAKYTGQLQGGFVTTDNLPTNLQQPGLKIKVALEINAAYSPRCLATAVLYTAVKVKNICESSNAR
ncbi:hypothetical protein [uncultured Pontibacter sp.]|uniref:hypothetical protein n=1 Tax=uncultured Pontibacter sp. TaxID=453356 RepID=UPI002620DCC2|nr:hypothetical protein [uncultured Pontibacter sp.]